MNRPLSEGAFAECVEGMRIMSSASNHIDRVLGALKHCKVSVDSDSFKHIQFYLDKLHADIARKALESAEAAAAIKSGAAS